MDSLNELRVIGGDMSLEPIKKQIEKLLEESLDEQGRQVILLYAHQVNIECPHVSYNPTKEGAASAREAHEAGRNSG